MTISRWLHIFRSRTQFIYSHPVEGNLLLAYRAIMAEIFQSRREVSAWLHCFQYICGAETAPLQTQDALKHFSFLTLDTTWDLTVGSLCSAILYKVGKWKVGERVMLIWPLLTSMSSNFFSWIRNRCSLMVITLSGCLRTCSASGKTQKWTLKLLIEKVTFCLVEATSWRCLIVPLWFLKSTQAWSGCAAGYLTSRTSPPAFCFLWK